MVELVSPLRFQASNYLVIFYLVFPNHVFLPVVSRTCFGALSDGFLCRYSRKKIILQDYKIIITFNKRCILVEISCYTNNQHSRLTGVSVARTSLCHAFTMSSLSILGSRKLHMGTVSSGTSYMPISRKSGRDSRAETGESHKQKYDPKMLLLCNYGEFIMKSGE